jgi:hypothetical protein
MMQPALEHRLQAKPLDRIFASRVELLLAICQLLHQGVEEEIARSGVEPCDLLYATISWQIDELGHRAEMDHQAIFVRVIGMEKDVVRQGGERHTDASRRKIARPEVAYRGYAASLGYYRWHAKIEKGRKTAFRISPDRLPRAAKALHFLKTKAGPIGRESCGRGK